MDGRGEDEIIRVNVTPAYHVTTAPGDTPGGQCGIYTHTHELLHTDHTHQLYIISPGSYNDVLLSWVGLIIQLVREGQNVSDEGEL